MLDKYKYTYDSRRFSAHWIRGKFPPPRRPPFSARFLCREKAPQPPCAQALASRVHPLRPARVPCVASETKLPRNCCPLRVLAPYFCDSCSAVFNVFFFRVGVLQPHIYVSPGRDGCFARASLWGLRAGIRSTTGITAPARNMPLYFCCRDHGSFFVFCFVLGDNKRLEPTSIRSVLRIETTPPQLILLGMLRHGIYITP